MDRFNPIVKDSLFFLEKDLWTPPAPPPCLSITRNKKKVVYIFYTSGGGTGAGVQKSYNKIEPANLKIGKYQLILQS